MFQICHTFDAIFDIILQTFDRIIKDNGENGVNIQRARQPVELAINRETVFARVELIVIHQLKEPKKQ